MRVVPFRRQAPLHLCADAQTKRPSGIGEYPPTASGPNALRTPARQTGSLGAEWSDARGLPGLAHGCHNGVARRCTFSLIITRKNGE
jgi:hypothetical protein